METYDWSSLDHAYGDASDIPELLQKLSRYPKSTNYDDEPFYTLWSSLYHQGDIYSASYYVVPFIVDLIEKSPKKVDYNYFLLPCMIELSRLKGNGPNLPRAIKKEYSDAIKRLGSLTSKIPNPDKNFITVLSAATAISLGYTELGETIIELTPDNLQEFRQWLES